MHKLVPVFRNPNLKNIRTFLSESYKCIEHWDKRFSSPILQKVRLEELAYGIDQKFQRKEPVSPIDIDVFANAIKDDAYLNDLRDLIHKFRRTKQTAFMLESTNYATIRHFIDADKVDDLFEMLDDRLNYGLFLDDYTGNMLLDKLLVQENIVLAAKVASLFMLQENFNNKLTENLSKYACYKYFNSLKPEEPTPVPEEPVKKKKEEEIKVRVRYLVNPYFDDHFDLRDQNLLIGKTLYMLSSKQSDVLNLNLQLIGLLFFKKIEKMNIVAQEIIKKESLLEDTLKIVEISLQQNHIREDPTVLPAVEQLVSQLKNVAIKEKIYINECLISTINNSLNSLQEEQIHTHSRIFEQWEEMRKQEFEKQIQRIEELRLEQEEKEKMDKLIELEEKIWFFENEEKVDMKIDENEKLQEELNKKHPKKVQTQDEEYIPPEIVKQTNSQ